MVYRVPPMAGATGYIARQWNLSKPMATLNAVLVSKGDDLFIKFHQKGGKLFAKSTKIDARAVASGTKPLGAFLDSVSDSSRYFVVRIENPKTGQTLPLGFGFATRGAASNLNASVDDHIQRVRRKIEYEKEKSAPAGDDDDIFGSFGATVGGATDAKGQDQVPATLFNLAPPPAEAGSGTSGAEKKSKKKKKKKARKRTRADPNHIPITYNERCELTFVHPFAPSTQKKKTKNDDDFDADFDAGFANFGAAAMSAQPTSVAGGDDDWADFGDDNAADGISSNATGNTGGGSTKNTTADILGLF